jgi:hypothetical protein
MGRMRTKATKEEEEEHLPGRNPRTPRMTTCATLLTLLLCAATTTTIPSVVPSAHAYVQIPTLAADSPVTYAGSSAHYLKQYDVCGVVGLYKSNPVVPTHS